MAPLVVLALTLCGGAASATVVVPAGLDELTHDAQAIVRGRVVAVDAQWTGGRRTIETIVTLQAEDCLKGGVGETVQFKVPGGTLGRFTSLVVGAPRFSVGQHVIVFLGARGPMVPFVVGFNQGVFHVVDDVAGAATVVPSPALPTAAGPVVRGSVSRAPSPLAAFEREVRALAGEAR